MFVYSLFHNSNSHFLPFNSVGPDGAHGREGEGGEEREAEEAGEG